MDPIGIPALIRYDREWTKGESFLKRLLSLVMLAITFTLAATGVAGAHSAAQIAAISTKGHQVIVRMVDVYGAPVAEVPVGAVATEPGKLPGKYARLTEGPAGTYTGTVTPPKVEVYQLNVETTLGGEAHRGSLRVRVGEDLPETLIPLVPVLAEEQKGLGWSAYLYIAALVVVAAATAMAFLRKKPAGEEE